MLAPRRVRHRSRPGCRPGGEAGFTLLEVLVAVMVMVMIVGTAFGALRLGVRSWEGGVVRATETEDLRMVADLLRRQFTQLLPLTWPDSTEKRLAFEGDQTRVRFIAPAPPQHQQAGLYEFTLGAERQASGTRLVLSYARFVPGAEGFQASGAARKVTLVEGLEAVSFDYYGKRTPDGAEGWHRTWFGEAEEFPQMIRLQLTTPEGDRQWPALLLALRAWSTP